MIRFAIIFIIILFSTNQIVFGMDGSGKDENYLSFVQEHINKEEYSQVFVIRYKIFSEIENLRSLEHYSKLLFQLSSQYYKQRYYDSAIIISSLADSVLNTLNNPRNEISCKVKYLQGLLLYQMDEFEKSKSYFKEALRLGDISSNDSITSFTLKYLGNIYFNQKNYLEALNHYKTALTTNLSSDSNSRILTASLFQNIGISYSMINMNDSAMQYLQKSISLKETYLDTQNPILAAGYLNISRLYQLNGELSEALKYIEKAEQIYLLNKDQSKNILAPIYLNKGSILLTLNDYEQALHYHELAHEQYIGTLGDDSELITGIYLNLGLIYNNLERFDESIFYLKLCLNRELSNDQKVKAYTFLGLSYIKKVDYTNAKKYLLLAINISNQKLENSNIQSANLFLTYGLFCELENSETEALYYYQEAEKIFIKIFGKKNRDLSYTYNLIGNNLLINKNPNEALIYFQRAIVAFIEEFNDTNVFENPRKFDLENDLNLFYALLGKAKSLYFSSDLTIEYLQFLNLSLSTAELAITLLERIKSTLSGENTKLLINSRASEIYDLAVTIAAELYNFTGDQSYLDMSFKYSEKSKAAILLSTIKEIEALKIGNLPENIVEAERDLKRSITQFQNQIYEENQITPVDSNKISRLRNRLFESKLKYDSLVASIESNYPEYYNLKYNFDVVSIPEIQRKLNHDQCYLEYKLTDSTLFTFIITKDHTSMIGKKIDPDFTKKINQFLELINQLPKTDSVTSRSYEFAQLGIELSDLLELNNPSVKNYKNLIIIPDDVLGYLSFDALITELPDKESSNYSKLKYLIYQHAISYGYSGTLFFNKIREKQGQNRILAFAPTYEHIKNQNIEQKNIAIRDLEKYLVPLPNTTNEVNSIVEIFSGDKYLGNEASETAFKSHASEYSILHFAMHTIINDEEPLASKLVFSVGTADTLNDGFLNTYEIYNLDLNAKLAVLSACRTGTGKMSKGEGIMSLARGFLYAGVPGIIMTLWAVEDISGAEVIKGFYRYLYSGDYKDVALRNAKLDYIQTSDPLHSHPYFWAAYVQIGDTSPLSSNQTVYIYFGMAGVFTFFIMILFLLWKLRNKSETN